METSTNVKERWQTMAILLAAAIPQWVIGRMTQRHAGKPFAIKAIPFVIVFLSVASVANLAGRAYAHHGDYSAYMTGAGIAILVPIAVLAAMMIDGSWGYAFWAMAVVFAGVSGTIQYGVYDNGEGIAAMLEAISFGYGVPLSEVMLAVMEARLILQYDARRRASIADEQRRQAAIADEQRQSAHDNERRLMEAERRAAEDRRQIERDNENREFERQKQQIELDAHRAKLAQDAELEREKTLTELRIKEQRAAAKLIQSDSKSDSLNQKAESPESAVLDFFRSNPLASQRKAADSTGVSQAKISRILNQLESSGVIHRNGNGVEILN